MASLMENLMDVLERESGDYEELLKLSGKKTPAIVGGDLEALQKITDEEQEVVGRLQRFEKERTELTADIANVLNRDVEECKLTQLIQMLEGRADEQRRLAEIHDRLKGLVERLRRVNEQNRELIANAMELVEFDMNIIQSMNTAPETANYNRGAYSAGSTIGVLNSGFDAKQ